MLPVSRWIRPFGIRLTDWVAVLALLLSVAGIVWTVLARQWLPSVDVAYPEEVQFHCLPYDDRSQRCVDGARVYVLGDLFSLWNNSVLSTKPELLNRVEAVVVSDAFAPSFHRWKFFTQILDSEPRPRANTARTILRPGELENLEVEFLPDPRQTDAPLTWEALWRGILADDVSVDFFLAFGFGSDRFARCALSFRLEDLVVYKSGRPSGGYVVADSLCREHPVLSRCAVSPCLPARPETSVRVIRPKRPLR